MPVVSNQQLLDPLNESQREAVTHVDGPLLILAGPGSGKTRVITHRIAYLISQGIPSHTIVALTFTNKAADEMRVRIDRLVSPCSAWTGTFHKFCAQLLRIHASLIGLSENFTIYDMGDSRKVVKQAIENAEVNPQHYSAAKIQDRVSNLKGKGVTPEDFQPAPGNVLQAILARVYPEYQKLLRMANAVDFDDLLLYAVDLLRQNPELRESLDLKYQYVMVDEYQDTNLAQYQLIRLLNHDMRNLGVTGDPDQSIYGWRGANLNNILEFERDFPDVCIVRLEQNYRSTKSVLAVADQLIENNVHRKHKSLRTDNPQGKPVRLVAYPNPQEEASDIADTISLAVQSGNRRPRDFAVLYRANWLSRALEHALRLAGIPYQVVNGQEFYQRREIKDILAYLHLLNNPSDNIALERVINVPSRKIGKVTIGRIRDYAMRNGISMLDAARQCGLIETIAKGAATKVVKFVALYDELAEWQSDDVEVILKKVISRTGYRDWLTDDGSEEGHERAGNVDELVVAAQEFDAEHPDDGGLESYLEQAALVSDTDAWESEADYVTLMTLHGAKGLEFPCVFIVGMEDGLLPHERSRGSAEQLEEERRLLFVGITRAEEELQLSRCQSRFRRGSFWPSIPSGFLMELPRSEMQVFQPQPRQAYNHDDGDVPFDIDPWMHEGFDGENPADRDLRGLEEEEPHFPPTDSPPGKIREAGLPRLMTGSELARIQEESPTRLHPSVFAEGMQVQHKVYGVGTILDISGKQMKKTATVSFPGLGKRRFRLAFCKLEIVDSQ